MVSYPIVWTKKAIHDLQIHFSYLCEAVEHHEAKQMIQSIVNHVDVLETQPQIGQKEPYLLHLKRTYRRLIKEHYKIIYSFRNNKVYIHCIFDTRQNPKKMKIT
ncbi:MAG: type II toxin-antitoxin system RelE/ParE family toxin [Saprospiraceae bacterium]|nr:type II toxin-antitoxin system RelE/ParE family toxin [Saprospiraceae bacterium]